jgi:hypothetical protein
MYIDADCHISSRAPSQGISVDELLRHLDAAGVDKAVAWPMVSYVREMATDNRAIYEGVRQHPDRLIPFGGVNPLLGLEAAQEELVRCIEVYGMRGVKLNGARDGYYIDDPRLSLPLIDTIADAGLVLAFHVGANDFEKTHPYRVAKISERHPDLPIMIVHMGGAAHPDIHDAVIDLAATHPNWYLIDSETDYRQELKALQVLGATRVCYGSDTPFCPMRYEWALRQVVLADLSPADRALVLGGNMARLLGLA